MIEHSHVPRSQRRTIEIPRLPAPGECPFCSRPSAIQKTGQCKFCGVWVPSSKSISKPRPKSRKLTPPRVDRLEYTAEHDPANWPTIDETDESLPWEE